MVATSVGMLRTSPAPVRFLRGRAAFPGVMSTQTAGLDCEAEPSARER